MTHETAFTVARDERAPADERYDANAELTKSAISNPAERILPLIEWVRDSYADQEMNKSLPNVIPFPSMAARKHQPGMQSVQLDDNQVGIFGEYYESPGSFGFDSMRQMVLQTPILNSIVMTRIRQVQRFCRSQENGKGPGFEIRLRDREATVGNAEKESIAALEQFFTHCGWENNPRARARLKRDEFTTFMSKSVRDTLTMDSAPIETEYKKDKKLGMDGFYAVDGATIRLCTEAGYKGDDEIRALQVVQGQLRSAYTFDDLIYQPRNPRSDVLVGGYGLGEPEMLVTIVTHMLNAMTYNGKYFDSNSIPKGLLHLSGDYDTNDLAAFKRMWQGMVKGISNAWAMPVMVSKDQESKASFEKFGCDITDMQFEKWTSFLTSVACAIYGIGPDEINIASFSSNSGGLSSGADTGDKIAASKDKGLLPLLHYYENLFSDYVVADFSDKYCFRFTGLDDEDEKQKFEEDKLILSVNELRANRGYDKMDAAWGDAPLNPSLVGAWQAEAQAGQEDYGQPGEAAGPGEDKPDFGGGADGEQDFGQSDAGGAGKPPGAEPPAAAATDDEPMSKSFGLPIFKIEA